MTNEMTNERSTSLNAIALNLAEQTISHALAFSQILTQLYLRSKPADGVTALRAAMSLVPELPHELDTHQVKVGKNGAIGSTYLTNEAALDTCFLLRAQLASFRPLGAEIIHSALNARAQVDETMRQILLIDWSAQGWNPQVMQTVNRYRTFVLGISRTSSAFAHADEGDQEEKFKTLLRDELIPECHKLAAQLIRTCLPQLREQKEQILAVGSETLTEFDGLWSKAVMPLFRFVISNSSHKLPPATKELLLNIDELGDVRDSLPEIFTSFAQQFNGSKTAPARLPRLDMSNFGQDNFRVVPEFAELCDFLVEVSDFTGLASLVAISYAELSLQMSLIKMDLVAYGLELDDDEQAQPLQAFFSAFAFASTKFAFSHKQLVDEVRNRES
jgi:hypothetical protein